jgi:hypothetical protein
MATSYAAKNVTSTVDGQKVLGLWDGDDAITVEPLADIGEMLVGADGTGLFSQSSNEGATITLRLQHTSPTHRLLSQRLARQRAPGIRVTGFPFTVVDVDSGEGGSASEVFIQTAPTDQKGTVAVVREWVLVTANYRPEIPNA